MISNVYVKLINLLSPIQQLMFNSNFDGVGRNCKNFPPGGAKFKLHIEVHKRIIKLTNDETKKIS